MLKMLERSDQFLFLPLHLQATHKSNDCWLPVDRNPLQNSVRKKGLSNTSFRPLLHFIILLH